MASNAPQADRRYQGEEKLKVLIIGDPPGSPGGIAQVMSLVSAWCTANPAIRTRFLDPLGKATPSSKRDFAGLIHTIYRMLTERPNVVHLNTASRGSTYRNIVVTMVARPLRIPYVIHLHGGGYPSFFNSSSARRQHVFRSFFQHASKVIALTPSWKQFVVGTLGVPECQVCVVPNGTADPITLKIDIHDKEQTPTFVYAGRLTAPKGVPELIEAFRKLPDSVDANLILIGGEMDQTVSASLSTQPHNVTLLGWRSNSETLKTMAKAWAVILPSHFENMPLTILEAMSVSTAVVATNVGGIPEVVREKLDGLMLEPGDINGLSEAILTMCDLNQSIAFGKNGLLNWQTNYTSDRMCQSITNVWRDASK